MANKIHLIFFLTCTAAVRDDYDATIKRLEHFQKLRTFSGQGILIFPGTYWCGMGNISPDNDTLGTLKKTDACCKAHDLCPDILRAGESKYNLTNTACHTRLNCTCDRDFYNCLRNNKDVPSDTVGKIYFNTIGTQCYKSDYPITGCSKFSDCFGRRCANYTFDATKPKKYQWFDVAQY